METLQVRINDVYAQTNFNIEVPDISADSIKNAIESKYDSFCKKLERCGGGIIRVIKGSREVASGSIVWWLCGGHTIRIEES